MSGVKRLIEEAEMFAQEHYNIPRKEFVAMADLAFDYREQRDIAIRHFDQINEELNEYFSNEVPF